MGKEGLEFGVKIEERIGQYLLFGYEGNLLHLFIISRHSLHLGTRSNIATAYSQLPISYQSYSSWGALRDTLLIMKKERMGQ